MIGFQLQFQFDGIRSQNVLFASAEKKRDDRCSVDSKTVQYTIIIVIFQNFLLHLIQMVWTFLIRLPERKLSKLQHTFLQFYFNVLFSVAFSCF